jgi:hypothetical protein
VHLEHVVHRMIEEHELNRAQPEGTCACEEGA